MAQKPETLAPEPRIPLSVRRLFLNAGCVVKNTSVMACTTAAGVSFGAQLLFIRTAQSVFSQIYPTDDMFVVYFAVLAASIGLATLAISRLVSTVGMHKMVFYGAGSHVFWIFLDFFKFLYDLAPLFI